MAFCTVIGATLYVFASSFRDGSLSPGVTDPSAEKDRDKSATVTLLDRVQPVPPPAAMQGFDFRPVVFEGLMVEPRVMGEKFKYQGWVLRAIGMREPSRGTGSKQAATKTPAGEGSGSQQKAA
jgi:hypothetical protein